MTKFKAILPIKHNGRSYCIGDDIELEAEHSARLLEIKAVCLLASDKKGKGGGTPPPTPSAKIPEKSKKSKKLEAEKDSQK